VIEGGRVPIGRPVTNLALLWEASRRVVRVVCVLEILQVARHAYRGRQVVVPVGMTLSAGNLQVRSGKRESRL